jgi:hypothetical protein
MNTQEVAQVLVKVQQGDSRKTDRTVLVYWEEVIGHLRLDDALQGVLMHRQEQPGVWLEPGHVVRNAARAREARQRAERMARPAIEPQSITLDRAEFERITQAAIEEARRERAAERSST